MSAEALSGALAVGAAKKAERKGGETKRVAGAGSRRPLSLKRALSPFSSGLEEDLELTQQLWCQTKAKAGGGGAALADFYAQTVPSLLALLLFSPLRCSRAVSATMRRRKTTGMKHSPKKQFTCARGDAKNLCWAKTPPPRF